MDTVNMTSPGYPSCNFPSHFQKTWTVHANQGLKVSVEVISFLVHDTDFVTFGNGDDSTMTSSVLAELTSTNKLHVVTSRDSLMWIKMESGSWGSDTYRGFLFDVQQLNDTTGES